jgi:hypothetical protein
MDIASKALKNADDRLIIGSGKLAKHLTHWWTLKNIPFVQWSRQQDPLCLNLAERLNKAQYIFLAISDSAIEPFFSNLVVLLESNSIDWRSKQFVHFSGSLSIPMIKGAHPLMTFGPELYTEAKYDSISFFIDFKETSLAAFSDAFPNHPNRSIEISKEQKSLYHALIVMLGNLPSLMLKEFNPLLNLMNIESDNLRPYLMQSLENSLNNPNSAPTGPWVRGDFKTVHSHQRALSNTPYIDFYNECLKTFGKTQAVKSQEQTNVQF